MIKSQFPHHSFSYVGSEWNKLPQDTTENKQLFQPLPLTNFQNFFNPPPFIATPFYSRLESIYFTMYHLAISICQLMLCVLRSSSYLYTAYCIFTNHKNQITILLTKAVYFYYNIFLNFHIPGRVTSSILICGINKG